ncbi:MAG: redoxin domain-containing protein [Sedimentisphaerales bacterium]|nr:redoxin domain-containing protein [Sedimentisphaerales bacterium]
MTRNLLSVAVLMGLSVCVGLALTPAAIAQPGEGARPDGSGEDPAARLAAVQQQQQINELEQRIESVKKEHQQLIAELRSLHQVALKEQAQETAGTVEKLITKLQSSFQEKVGPLEREHQRLQIAARVRVPRAGRAERQARQAPDFTLNSFDGRTFSLSDLKGKIVVLEWVNMECPFSRYHYETKSTMADLAKKYKDRNVVWLAVNSTNHTTAEANLEFAKKHELPFPILDDRSGRVGRLYGAKTTPHVFVIDPEGHIVYNGAIDSAPMGKVAEGGQVVNYADQALAQLTTGQEVATASTPPYGCSVKYPR